MNIIHITWDDVPATNATATRFGDCVYVPLNNRAGNQLKAYQSSCSVLYCAAHD